MVVDQTISLENQMRLTLCGSAKFEVRFHEWNEKLTLKGHTVYSLAIYPSSKNGEKNWYTEAQKTTLDLIHLDKIQNSEGIVVLNEDGYYGDSTTREIAWARICKKRVFWTMPHMSNLPSGDAWAGILV